eukprot:TRINITY_DN2938_c0_g1_i1.p1 TRINITY_DN2938_c0_g1~~TRINITY_DN2938_c0_g1_i1.p1  ORF type:complete len:182 (+),score=37.69 TRINITY_DN2938_c0_g1_i1:369-914(+)
MRMTKATEMRNLASRLAAAAQGGVERPQPLIFAQRDPVASIASGTATGTAAAPAAPTGTQPQLLQPVLATAVTVSDKTAVTGSKPAPVLHEDGENQTQPPLNAATSACANPAVPAGPATGANTTPVRSKPAKPQPPLSSKHTVRFAPSPTRDAVAAPPPRLSHLPPVVPTAQPAGAVKRWR